MIKFLKFISKIIFVKLWEKRNFELRSCDYDTHDALH